MSFTPKWQNLRSKRHPRSTANTAVVHPSVPQKLIAKPDFSITAGRTYHTTGLSGNLIYQRYLIR
jgi:hypothetical protein